MLIDREQDRMFRAVLLANVERWTGSRASHSIGIIVEESRRGRDSPPVPQWLAPDAVTYITILTGSRARVQPLLDVLGRRGAEDEAKEARHG